MINTSSPNPFGPVITVPTVQQYLQLVAAVGVDHAVEYVKEQQSLCKVSLEVWRSSILAAGQADLHHDENISFQGSSFEVGDIQDPGGLVDDYNPETIFDVSDRVPIVLEDKFFKRGYCYSFMLKDKFKSHVVDWLGPWPNFAKVLKLPLDLCIPFSQFDEIFVKYYLETDTLHVGMDSSGCPLNQVLKAIVGVCTFPSGTVGDAVSKDEKLVGILIPGLTIHTKIGGQTKLSVINLPSSIDSLTMFNLSLNPLVFPISMVWGNAVYTLAESIVSRLVEFVPTDGALLYCAISPQARDVLAELYTRFPMRSESDMIGFLTNLRAAIIEAKQYVFQNPTKSEYFVSTGLVFVTQVPGPTQAKMSLYSDFLVINAIIPQFTTTNIAPGVPLAFEWFLTDVDRTVVLADVVRTLVVAPKFGKTVQNYVSWLQNLVSFHPSISANVWMLYCSQTFANMLSSLTDGHCTMAVDSVKSALYYVICMLQETSKTILLAPIGVSTVKCYAPMTFFRNFEVSQPVNLFDTGNIVRRRLVCADYARDANVARVNREIYLDLRNRSGENDNMHTSMHVALERLLGAYSVMRENSGSALEAKYEENKHKRSYDMVFDNTRSVE